MVSPRKFYVTGALENCPSCYAWLPSLDLRLEPAPAPLRARVPAWTQFGETRRQIQAFNDNRPLHPVQALGRMLLRAGRHV